VSKYSPKYYFLANNIISKVISAVVISAVSQMPFSLMLSSLGYGVRASKAFDRYLPNLDQAIIIK
jgi:uncharacterized membrane protein (DUF485 family)